MQIIDYIDLYLGALLNIMFSAILIGNVVNRIFSCNSKYL